MATSSTFSAQFRQLVVSYVPRPPHPITAIRILSEPAANIRLAGEAKVVAPNAVEAFMKSRRDKSGIVFITLFFITIPFNC
jgi:hypothetical protein